MMEDIFSERTDAAVKNDCKKIDLSINKVGLSRVQERLGEIIHIAAQKGNLDVIRYLVKKKPSIIEKKNTDRDTIAHVAMRSGYPDIIKYVGEINSAILAERNKCGENIVHIAARFGDLEIIEFAKNKKILRQMMTKDSQGETPFLIAARNGNLNVLEYMVTNCFEDWWKCEKDMEDILKTAAMYDHLEIVKRFCPCIYQFKETIAEIAAQNGHHDIFFYIVDRESAYPTTFKKCFPHIFKKNITDVKMLESIFRMFSTLESSDSEDIITDVAATAHNLDIIRYIAEKAPSYFVKNREYRDEQFLMTAYRNDAMDLSILKLLKGKGIAFNGTTYYGKESILHLAAKEGHLDVIQLIGKDEPQIFEWKNQCGKTVSHIAAENGRLDIICCIADIVPTALDIKDSFDYTTLHLAVDENVMDMKTLKFLVEEKGVTLKTVNKNGQTIAHTAGEHGRFDIMSYVMRNELSVTDKKDNGGNSVLHVMAMRKNGTDMDTFMWLVEKMGLSLKKTNAHKEDVAHIAVNHQNSEVVQYILKKEPLAFNNATLDSALEANFINLNMMKFLVEKGASPSKRAASIVATKGDLDFVQYLVEETLPCFTEKNVIYDIAKTAAVNHHQNIVAYLVDRNPDLFILHFDILFHPPKTEDKWHMIECLEKACNKKIPTWDRHHFERNITHEIVRRGYKELLKYFIEKRTWDVNILNTEKEPPVFTAVRNARREILKYLARERKANLTLLNTEGNNILFVAAIMTDVDAMKFVLDEMNTPIDLEWRNNDGMTLFHVIFNKALTSNQLDTLDYVVKKGSCVDARLPNGCTPLHVATHQSNYKMCSYLLDHGANPKVQNDNGSDFLQILNFEGQEKEINKNVKMMDKYEDSDEIQHRWRRSIDKPSIVPEPFVSIFRNQEQIEQNYALPAFTVRTEGIGDIEANIYTSRAGIVNYLTMVMWSFRNGYTKLRNQITFPSPAATLYNRMDPSAITAVYTHP